jgi:poly-gamma-glutamate synthesis protein (capsule biosynthesis protein)
MNKNRLIAFLFFGLSNFLYSQESEENTLKLQFLGDIMGHGPQIKAAYDTQTKTYNYDANFKHIKPLLSQADFCIANLEVTLGTKPYRGYPQFSSPLELAVAIKKSGITILGTANNHSCDRRKKGILKTITILDSLEIKHMGTYISHKTKDSLLPLIIEKNNIRIVLLNYTYGTNGIPVPKGTVVNLLDKEIIASDVIKANALQPDQIIAFVHWGEQYRDLPSTSQKKWFTYFKSLGVNIVIGSHPHVVEPMEWNKKENSLVVYSLGNFVSNQRSFPRDGAVIFEITFTKLGEHTKISSANYQLTWVYKKLSKNKVKYMVLPVDEFLYKKAFFEKKADYNKMKKYALHAKKLFTKHNKDIIEAKPYTNFFFQIHNTLY